MSRVVLVCVVLLSAVVSAQDSPTFEVASIRPASPQTNDVRAGVRVAGAQVRFVSMSLKDFIGSAYGVKPQQIVGPDWLGQERFDLAATIPAGGSVAQVSAMLRALLVDRFQMTVHRETKEFPVYALGVAMRSARCDIDGRRLLAVVSAVGAGAFDSSHLGPPLRSAFNSGATLSPEALRTLDAASLDPLSGALEKRGLTLVSHKAPVEVIVVDALSRTPTEN
jgi:hypothetical protein